MIVFPDLPCFFDPEFNGKTGSLSNTESHHALHVLRLSIGDKMLVSSGSGHLALGAITQVSRTKVSYQVDELVENGNPGFTTTIACGILGSASRMEWMVEKLVELGVGEIWFYATARTGKKKVKIDRLIKTAIAALKQSRKPHLPIIKELSLDEVAKHSAEMKLLAVCDDEDRSHIVELPYAPQTLMVIGPEGDFSIEELQLFKNNGFTFCSLGKERLRSETAAVYSLISLNNKSALNE